MDKLNFDAYISSKCPSSTASCLTLVAIDSVPLLIYVLRDVTFPDFSYKKYLMLPINALDRFYFHTDTV
jgi:hypothetical protein